VYDWRLRECDFGARNGSPAAEVGLDRLDYCDRPYPGGESHGQAIRRVAGFLADLPTRWAGHRVMLIGHRATYRALEHVLNGLTVHEVVAADFAWQAEGWEYRLR
jgi:broad specificity phosphatase PhoE